jgi:crossover junction endodeoxyribonuclease RuvC
MGYGVVEEDGRDLKLIECGVVAAPAKAPIETRLLKIFRGLQQLLDLYHPAVVAVEEPFVVQSPRKSAMAVGEARAIALLAAAQRDIPVFQYGPSKVRSIVADYGGGDKEQVRSMVSLLLGGVNLDGERLDASDALAVAICHIRQAEVNALLAENPLASELAPKSRRRAAR